MERLGGYVQTADWKNEKHAPLIECADRVKSSDRLVIQVSVGKEIPHPNTTEHHIAWLQIYFQPDSEKFTQHLATVELAAHGASAKGANQGSAFADPAAAVSTTLKQSGVIYALAYCNIHGLWESAKRIAVE